VFPETDSVFPETDSVFPETDSVFLETDSVFSETDFVFFGQASGGLGTVLVFVTFTLAYVFPRPTCRKLAAPTILSNESVVERRPSLVKSSVVRSSA
jgi:hypothetical protein